MPPRKKPERIVGTVAGCPICKRRPQDGHDSYCSPERRANAEAERLAIDPPPPMVTSRANVKPSTPAAGPEILNLNHLTPKGDTPMSTALAEAAASLGLPKPSPVTVAKANCKVCGPQELEHFARKLDGTPHAICRPCRGDMLRRGGKATPEPIPQAVAERAYAAMTEPPPLITGPEDLTPVLPEVITYTEQDQAAAAEALAGAVVVDVPVAPPEPVAVRVEVPADIDSDIAACERRLADLQKVRELMASTPDDLQRLHRLVTEAMARKGGR